MSNIIDSIKLSGVTYTIQGSGGGGNPTVELTQAQYDALVTAGTVQADTYYIITDAQAGDLTQYWTSAQTNSAITEATSGKVDSNVYTAYTASTDTAIQGKQDTLVSGTNIKTINNESLLGSGNIDIQGGGGGGKAISAGTNISVTTGETADTINCTLPISAGTGNKSIVFGAVTPSYASAPYTTAGGYGSGKANHYTWAKKGGSMALGAGVVTEGWYSVGFGNETQTKNESEFASGEFNNSVSGSSTFGDSGNTLFSVGNGTADNARHNAFEIRQNGDIYITSGGTDIKLQDNLGGGGGGGSSYTAGDGIDITNNVISVTGKVDTTTYNTYTAATDTALATKQTTLTAGTGISIVDNVISATGGGGGGKAIEAGRGISVTTGETADTINCTLPISASTGAYSAMLGQPTSTSDASGSKTITGGKWSKAFSEGGVSIGQMNESRGTWAWAIGNGTSTNGTSAFACCKGTQANASNAFAEGEYCSANTIDSHAAGKYTITRNEGEFSIGEFNNSVSASTTFGNSGNTLFSVGNGTADNARHNAFEIRQNGDIYYFDGTNDVKLQDKFSSLDSTIGDINTILESI